MSPAEVSMRRLAVLVTMEFFFLAQLPPPAVADTNPYADQSPYVAFSGRNHNMPASAVPGSNAQRLAAYNSMTAQQIQTANALVTPYMTNAIQSAQQKYLSSVQTQDALLHTPDVDGRFARALTPLVAQETGLAFMNSSGTQTTVPLYAGSVNQARQNWPIIPGFH